LFRIDDYLPSAWIGHAPFLKFLIREQKPKIFVELGVHNGFSYFVGCQSILECGLHAKAFAIDHWKGDNQAGFYDNSVHRGVLTLNSKYSHFSTIIKMSFVDASHLFQENSIDLLHIDGFHTYDAVKQDFESWKSKMSDDGIILLHDIHVRRNTFGVHKFWEEIKEEYRTLEFVGSHGLGIVFLGEIPIGLLRDFYEHSLRGLMPAIQGAFGSISDDVIQNFRITSAVVRVMERDNAVMERDNAVMERDNAVMERDNAVLERDNAVLERDNAVLERDNAVMERDSVVNSRTWKLFSIYRKFRRGS